MCAHRQYMLFRWWRATHSKSKMKLNREKKKNRHSLTHSQLQYNGDDIVWWKSHIRYMRLYWKRDNTYKFDGRGDTTWSEEETKILKLDIHFCAKIYFYLILCLLLCCSFIFHFFDSILFWLPRVCIVYNFSSFFGVFEWIARGHATALHTTHLGPFTWFSVFSVYDEFSSHAHTQTNANTNNTECESTCNYRSSNNGTHDIFVSPLAIFSSQQQQRHHKQ